MRFDTLEAWLAWQETLNPRGIDLGLDRVRRVCERLGLLKPPFKVITVGGTNGKGSVAAYASAILQADGLITGRYLSPHILRYNERIAVNGEDVSDAELCRAFEAVEHARADEPLTYFEFGTLAALEIFRERGVEAAVLEVGLGGRLDAVNVIDADIAVVVSVGIDHVDWLGKDIDGIAREKAGIFRRGRPAIVGSTSAPAALAEQAMHVGASLQLPDRDYFLERHAGHWSWWNNARRFDSLPVPLPGSHQYANAAAALAAVVALRPALPVAAARQGIAAARLRGRLESLGGAPEIVLDVGHNPDAAACVAQYLRERPRPTHAVLAMLADKDAAGFVRELVPLVQHWHLATLPGDRGQSGAMIADRLAAAGVEISCELHEDVAAAVEGAKQKAPAAGRLLILGSFHTVEAFLVYSTQAGGSK